MEGWKGGGKGDVDLWVFFMAVFGLRVMRKINFRFLFVPFLSCHHIYHFTVP